MKIVRIARRKLHLSVQMIRYYYGVSSESLLNSRILNVHSLSKHTVFPTWVIQYRSRSEKLKTESWMESAFNSHEELNMHVSYGCNEAFV